MLSSGRRRVVERLEKEIENRFRNQMAI